MLSALLAEKQKIIDTKTSSPKHLAREDKNNKPQREIESDLEPNRPTLSASGPAAAPPEIKNEEIQILQFKTSVINRYY